MSTVALSMIVKDEFEEVMKLVDEALMYFNEINLVVSDKLTASKFQIGSAKYKNLNVKYRKWNDKFDEARNVAMKMCTTDYFFWLDADDSFDFRAIPQLVEIADENEIDAIFLPYNYMQDEQGNCITRHWRERLIRMDRGYSWRGWVHETCISEEKVKTHKVDFEIKHNATIDDAKGSYERNHKILEKAVEETDDPRYMHYLGMSYYTGKQYEKAAELLSDFMKVSKNPEDIYRSLSLISECAYHLGNHEQAMEFAMKCVAFKPKYPMGYWLLAQYEADQDNYEEALEWVRVSESKPDPDTLSVWDPSSRERATLIAARSLFMMGKYNQALQEIRKIRTHPDAQMVYPDFLQEADIEMFLTILPKIRKFFTDDKALYDALGEIKFDKRLKSLRNRVTIPKDWSDNSVVILCGQGYEEWGPHTLDKGMGGSEEAVVYLSRELAKLGYEVTVFGEAEMLDEEDVNYVPWQQFDKRDKFNIFVSWRAPQFVEGIDAKVKLVDMHDVLPQALVKDYPDTKYLVKSKYHRNLYPDLADDKFVIIGNGIKKEQFK